jgi:hypothetical protein
LILVDDGCECCNTSTTGYYSNEGYSYNSTSTTARGCNRCAMVQYVRIYETYAVTTMPEDIEPEIIPIQWKIIRSVFYVILMLRQYIEAVARAPPFFLTFNINSSII